mmetsp:Transcript_6853/g.26754  ORF Transcript_6853/g.26754 Transcript_6853/m.26754 type:complete len:226 (-) Transcript_6853:1806-2483(-)
MARAIPECSSRGRRWVKTRGGGSWTAYAPTISWISRTMNHRPRGPIGAHPPAAGATRRCGSAGITSRDGRSRSPTPSRSSRRRDRAFLKAFLFLPRRRRRRRRASRRCRAACSSSAAGGSAPTSPGRSRTGAFRTSSSRCPTETGRASTRRVKRGRVRRERTIRRERARRPSRRTPERRALPPTKTSRPPPIPEVLRDAPTSTSSSSRSRRTPCARSARRWKRPA